MGKPDSQGSSPRADGRTEGCEAVVRRAAVRTVHEKRRDEGGGGRKKFETRKN